AVRLYDQLLSESPDDVDSQLALANTLLNTAVLLSPRDHADELERLYARLMELNRAAVQAAPDRPGIQRELALGLEGQGMFFLATGRAPQALGMVREVLAIRQQLAVGGKDRLFIPYVARAHVNLARVLTAVGKEGEARQAYQEALQLLEQAAQEYPDTPQYPAGLAKVLLAWADLLKDPGRQDEVAQIRQRAIGLFEELTADVPEDVESRLRLGVLLEQSGRHAEAADQYRQALERNPEYHPVMNRLAWLLATSPEPRLRNVAEAVRLAEKAVVASPKAGNYWNTLGAAHYRNGDDRAAVAALEKAMSLREGGDSFDWFFLAMAHGRLGDRDQARVWLDRAVQWADKFQPQDEELRRFRAEAEARLAEAGKP